MIEMQNIGTSDWKENMKNRPGKKKYCSSSRQGKSSEKWWSPTDYLKYFNKRKIMRSFMMHLTILMLKRKSTSKNLKNLSFKMKKKLCSTITTLNSWSFTRGPLKTCMKSYSPWLIVPSRLYIQVSNRTIKFLSTMYRWIDLARSLMPGGAWIR